MTLIEPQLAVRRLLILKDGSTVFDEEFSLGTNIIRGQNSSGKTTIADSIFHLLGGEVSDWREEAKECDTVVGEVSINGELVTFRRDIDAGKSRRPLMIYWGSYASSKSSSPADWEKYPFAVSKTKRSFSQILFESLGIPEVEGSLDSRITMHQLLRLMYVDQLTPHDQVFIHEQFDRQLVRETVGDLMCGVSGSELYEAQIDLDEKQSNLKGIKSSINSIKDIIGDISDSLSRESLIQKKDRIKEERATIYSKIKVDRDEVRTNGVNDQEKQRIQELRDSLEDINNKISEHKDKIEELNFELSDSEKFIESLRRRKKAIESSTDIESELQPIPLNYCPACYAELDDNDKDDECPLCKSDLEQEGNTSPHKLERKKGYKTTDKAVSRAPKRKRGEIS
jgi:rubrerythrin